MHIYIKRVYSSKIYHNLIFALFGWDNSNFQVQSQCPSTILFSSTPQYLKMVRSRSQEVFSPSLKLPTNMTARRVRNTILLIVDLSTTRCFWKYILYANMSYMLTYQQQGDSANTSCMQIYPICSPINNNMFLQIYLLCKYILYVDISRTR